MSPLVAPRTPHVVKSSALSRDSHAVFAAAEKSPVEVTRRDGESLVLTTKRQFEAQDEILEAAAQLIAVSLDSKGTLVDRMAGPFPWIKLLNPADQEECARSIIDTARGAFTVHQPARFLVELTAWRDTAEAVAAGWNTEAIDWIDSADAVARP
jgi:PHD/YefM family antitoxin component YafN of YafNO toxin-antitoxin module